MNYLKKLTLCFLAVTILSPINALAMGGSVAITGGTIHPISSEPFVGDLIIREGLIGEIGPSLDIPTDAEVIDATGLHVYPGLFDAFGQLGLLEINSVAATDDRAELGMYNPHLRAATAIHPASLTFPVARSTGVTHAVVAPGTDRDGVIAGQAALVHLSGWTVEEMAIDPAIGMVIDWPAVVTRRFDRSTFSFEEVPIKEAEEEAATKINELKDWFDAARHYSKAARAEPRRARRDLRLEALAEVFESGLPIVVRADAKRDIEAAVAFAESEDVELILTGGRNAWELREMLAEKAIPVVLGRSQGLPSEEDDPYDRPYGNAGQLAEAGVVLAFASSAGGGFGPGGVHSVRNLPYESGTAAAYGLDRDEAVKALTLYPAQIYGVDDRLGSIETGKIANLIVTTDNPLEITSQLRHLIIDGHPTETEDRHERLYELYRGREQAAEEGSKP